METETINQVTETTANNLTDEEKQAKISELSQYESSIKEGIANPGSIIHEMVFSSERAIFQRWAETLKQLHYLGKYDKPLNTISTYIKKQIGNMKNLTIDKKDNLYRNVERSLSSEFKEERADRQNVGENTSAFSGIENSFLYKQLITFRNYHLEFASLVDELLKHFEHPEFGKEILKDFENSLEWRELAIFCSTLAALIEPTRELQDKTEKIDKALARFTTLEAIREDLNLRQAADTFRKCMMILRNDNMYRQMAHKFAVSPRQNQRIRERMEHWAKKDVKVIIEKVLSSFLCPSCKCDIITGRKPVNPTSDRFTQIRLNDFGLSDELKIPKEYRITDEKALGMSPIKIAEKVFSKKLKLVPV